MSHDSHLYELPTATWKMESTKAISNVSPGSTAIPSPVSSLIGFDIVSFRF